MGSGIAVAALLLALGQLPSVQERADVAALSKVEITPQLEWRSLARVQGGPLTVQAQRAPGVEPQRRAGNSFALGYLFGGQAARFGLRAGYRFGLPMDVPEPTLEDTLVLTSGGTLRVSAGTVTWLQLDLEAFRELAGARVLRLDAVPGVRVALSQALPIEGGAGLVVSTKTNDGVFQNRVAGLLQLGGRF